MKITKDQLIANRQAAGEAYRAAAKAYIKAWEDLHCHDLTCLNGRLCMSNMIVGGFAGQPSVVPHAEFMRDEAEIRGGAYDRAHAAHVQMIETIKD
jgi:hypothetical protein